MKKWTLVFRFSGLFHPLFQWISELPIFLVHWFLWFLWFSWFSGLLDALASWFSGFSGLLVSLVYWFLWFLWFTGFSGLLVSLVYWFLWFTGFSGFLVYWFLLFCFLQVSLVFWFSLVFLFISFDVFFGLLVSVVYWFLWFSGLLLWTFLLRNLWFVPNVNFLILNLNNPLAWILPHVPQHPLVQFSKHLLPLSVFSGQFLGLPGIQVSGLPGGLNALIMFVDLILFFLSVSAGCVYHASTTVQTSSSSFPVVANARRLTLPTVGSPPHLRPPPTLQAH